MILKINNILRWMILILGGAYALLKLFDVKGNRVVHEDEGFQTAEFDDIW